MRICEKAKNMSCTSKEEKPQGIGNEEYICFLRHPVTVKIIFSIFPHSFLFSVWLKKCIRIYRKWKKIYI